MPFSVRVRRTLAGVAAGLFLAGAAPASATLVKSYDFNGDLTDTLGNGADLVSFGGSLATSGLYTFSGNQGLRLDAALVDTSTYAIEMKVQMTSNGSFWKKLIDYQNLTSDMGLYIRSSSLHFYNASATGAVGIPVLTDAVITLTRDDATDLVSGYVDGALQWSFVDSGNLAVSASNVLHFFIDDNFGPENFPGSVDYIRIYDTSDTTVAVLARSRGQLQPV
ncbi:MAG: LamG-like jellyroll fold domain-containing protein, partial [Rhodospirillaceae bacterium]